MKYAAMALLGGTIGFSCFLLDAPWYVDLLLIISGAGMLCAAWKEFNAND